MTQEELRRKAAGERTAHWRRWGYYLAECQWGTVRADYTTHGNAWLAVTHDQARSQAYCWGEDGLVGICDTHQRLGFVLARRK